jgi:GMP synthase-like glutamine amidotransferase
LPTCLVVQHVAPESAFAIGEALVEAGISVETCRVFAGDAVPIAAQDFDGLVVMGGPMSAASNEGFASRPSELALLSEALELGLPTIGVCLGAQLLAVAAGASVYPGGSGPEIGWGPVTLLPECNGDPLFAGLDGEHTVMHWHGDTFNLPTGAMLLGCNSNYANQAFRLGTAAWGLQFHLEVTESAVNGFISNFGADAEHLPGGAEGIGAAAPTAVNVLTPMQRLVFGRFAALVLARVSHQSLVDQ